MTELIVPDRPKLEQKQFTITMEAKSIEELRRLATLEALAFHKFIKAVLLTYAYKKRMESENKI
jgi:hypothetical protein